MKNRKKTHEYLDKWINVWIWEEIVECDKNVTKLWEKCGKKWKMHSKKDVVKDSFV